MRTFIIGLFILTNSMITLGQRSDLKFSSLKKLPFEINSDAEEIMPITTAKGNKLYFVRAMHKQNIGGRFGGQDIWYAEKDQQSGKWKKPQKSLAFNNSGNNAVVGVDKTGNRLFLLNSYEDSVGGKSGLSYSDYKENQWTYPKLTEIEDIYNLGDLNDIYGLNVNDESDVLLISMKGENSLGEEDLYVCFKFTGWNRFHKSNINDVEDNYWWSHPIHLGNVINSANYEISPFLSPDGKTLFFSSNRPGGFGNADIYYSKRLDDTWKNWSKPINLGTPINSRAFDAYFFMNHTDSTVYFASGRGGRFSNIFYTQLLVDNENILVKKDTAITTKDIAEFVQEKEEKKEDKVNKESFVRGGIVGEIMDEELIVKDDNDLFELNKVERNILFDNDSYSILLKDRDVLESTIAILKHNPKLKIVLIGHTDHVGNHDDNKILSKNRSNAVKNYLIEKGIIESRIVTEGHGETKPIATNDHDHGRKQNRRVELEFILEE